MSNLGHPRGKRREGRTYRPLTMPPSDQHAWLGVFKSVARREEKARSDQETRAGGGCTGVVGVVVAVTEQRDGEPIRKARCARQRCQ